MDNPCTLCERPTDGTACHACGQRIARQLDTIAELTPDARAVAARQTRRGPAVRGTGHERPLPIDLAAGARLDAVQNELTTWARHVAEERGLTVPASADPLEAAARWLAGQVEWCRHREEIGEYAQTVGAAVRVLSGIVDNPGDRRWLGQCGADVEGEQRCEGDVYARVGGTWARCRVCGASFATDERRAWLDGLARERSYTARDIGQAYDIPEATIRTWAHRGLISPDLIPLPPGVEGPLDVHRDEWGRPRPEYLLGPVLDLATRKHAAREERRARRMATATYPDTTDMEAAS